MLLKYLRLLVALATLSLAACGGGGDDLPAQETPADLTITQRATRIIATPGERVDVVTALNFDCPRMSAQLGLCATSTRMGDFGITLQGIGLTEPELSFGGGVVSTEHIPEKDGLHRLRPFDWFVFQSGEARVSAVISPYAKDGAVARVGIQATSAAFDRVVKTIPNVAEVVVVADPAYEPMIVTSTDQFVVMDTFGDITKITIKCGDSVSECYVGMLRFRLPTNVAPIMGHPRVEGAEYNDTEVGFDDGGMYAYVFGVRIPQGQTASITFRAGLVQGNANVKLYNTWSAGKEISPKLPQYCQAAIVSPEVSCKG